MNLLLDTHVFLWWLRDDHRLGLRARHAIEAPTNSVFVSAASIWEIAIKLSAGKLKWRDTAKMTLESCIGECGFTELPVAARHAAAVRSLPFHHADPFDRLLISQAVQEDLSIVTADDIVGAYGVGIVRADH